MPTKELVIFTRQFATMIDAGLPLVQCLDIQADQQPNKRFKEILRDVKSEVEQGSTFADALRRHPKLFDELYANLVPAGEIGGILDTILNRLAIYLEKAEKLKRKVKGAMVYPATILVVAIGVVVLLLVKVIPVFEKMFTDFGGALPGPDPDGREHQPLHAAVHRAASWRAMFGAVFAFFWARRRSRRVPLPDRRDLPEDADLRLAAPQGRGRALHPHARHDALDRRADPRRARHLRQDRRQHGDRAGPPEDAHRDLRGQARSPSRCEASGVFPGMVVQMIAVGEQTGAMDAMLNKIADFYDDEVDTAVDALTSLLEPLMMVFLGGTVGGLLIAMYLPIFKLAENIK